VLQQLELCRVRPCRIKKHKEGGGEGETPPPLEQNHGFQTPDGEPLIVKNMLPFLPRFMTGLVIMISFLSAETMASQKWMKGLQQNVRFGRP